MGREPPVAIDGPCLYSRILEHLDLISSPVSLVHSNTICCTVDLSMAAVTARAPIIMKTFLYLSVLSLGQLCPLLFLDSAKICLLSQEPKVWKPHFFGPRGGLNWTCISSSVMYNLGGGPRFTYVSTSSRHQNNKLLWCPSKKLDI